jgi:hypothetical protein
MVGNMQRCHLHHSVMAIKHAPLFVLKMAKGSISLVVESNASGDIQQSIQRLLPDSFIYVRISGEAQIAL